jgi:hypothetical protein
MGRNSVIRELPDEVRLDIQAQLVRGISKASICRQYSMYGINKDMLLYWERNELSGRLAGAWLKKSENSVVQVLDEMDELLETSKGILQDAIEKGHNTLALKAVAQIRNGLELVARIQAAIAAEHTKQQIIEVTDRIDTSIIQEGLRSLSPDEFETLRELHVKILHNAGGNGLDNPINHDVSTAELSPIADVVFTDVRGDWGEEPTAGGDRPILTGTNEPEKQELEYRVDPLDSTLKPVRTRSRKVDPDPGEMRRTNFK